MAEPAKLDPMHQFAVQPITHLFDVGGREVWLTNSAVWMLLAAGALWLFMLGGMKRSLVPGRWQAAVEGFTGFISSMMTANIGTIDRVIRIALAILIGVLYFTEQISGTTAIISGVLAVVFLLTSFIAWCPLYLPFGISTRKRK